MHPSVPALVASLLALCGSVAAAEEPWGKHVSGWERVSFYDVNHKPHDLFRNRTFLPPQQLYEFTAVGDEWQAQPSAYYLADAVVKVKNPHSSQGVSYAAPQWPSAFDSTKAIWGRNTVRSPQGAYGEPLKAEPTPFRILAGPLPDIDPSASRRKDPNAKGEAPAGVKYAALFSEFELLLGYGELDPTFKINDAARDKDMLATVVADGDSQHNCALNTAVSGRRVDAVDVAKKLLTLVDKKCGDSDDCFPAGQDVLVLRMVEFRPGKSEAAPTHELTKAEEDAARKARLAAFYAKLQAAAKADKLPPFVAEQRAFVKWALDEYVKQPKPNRSCSPTTVPAAAEKRPTVVAPLGQAQLPALTKAQPKLKPDGIVVPSPLATRPAVPRPLTPAELKALKDSDN